MSLHKFNLGTLTQLDGGRIPLAWEQALQRAVSDCEDRPNDKKPRKVILELNVVPVPENDGGIVRCESVQGSFTIKDTVPTRKSKTYSFGLKQNGLVFSDESPQSIQQLGFGDVDDPETLSASQKMADNRAKAS